MNKITLDKYSKKYSKKLGLLLLFLTSFLLPIIILSGCSSFKVKDKADYLLKTEPEKAVIDFLSSLNDKHQNLYMIICLQKKIKIVLVKKNLAKS